jgi:hypothetical protein
MEYDEKNTKPQHLYIISDDPIKNNDHYLGRNNVDETFIPFKCGSEKWNDVNGWAASERYKIVATTNEKLYVFYKIPESFLTAYAKCDGNIDEINVEYQTDWNESTKSIMLGYGDDPDDYPYNPSPRRRDDGTIIILQSKTYTREETENLIYSAMKDRAYTSTAFFNEWIDKNM